MIGACLGHSRPLVTVNARFSYCCYNVLHIRTHFSTHCKPAQSLPPQTYSRTHAHMHARTCTRTHTYIHARTPTHTHCMRALPNSCRTTPNHTHKHARAHARTHASMHAHTHVQTNMQTHARADNWVYTQLETCVISFTRLSIFISEDALVLFICCLISQGK